MKPKNSISEQAYESAERLNQYLLFHYGDDRDQFPFDLKLNLQAALNFPIRCVTECVDPSLLPQNPHALDLGCAVGRSTFELSRFCEHVLGVDNSQSFIHAAIQIQQRGHLDYEVKEEACEKSKRTARLPEKTHPSKVNFQCLDVMDLSAGSYDIVLAANLICRLPDPEAFLKKLPHLVASSGQLVLLTPYSWLEEFTPRNKWLQGKTRTEGLKKILSPMFQLKKTFDMPFLIREHLRKYELGFSEASLWIRK